MKNREKFVKEILDIACSGSRIAMAIGENKLRPCNGLSCDDCVFHNVCRDRIREWCESEYEEPKITIPEDAKVDTKILVSNDGENWCRRHFAKIKDGILYAWENGSTSWTNNFGTNAWKYGKLAEEENE